jgi:hypothetical protein
MQIPVHSIATDETGAYMKRRDFFKRSVLTVASAAPLLDKAWGANTGMERNKNQKLFTLESKGLLLQVTPDGLLWGMTNVHSGHSYLAKSGQSIWKFILSSQKEWILPVFSGDSAAQVSRKDDRLEIVHEGIRLRNETVPIKVRTEVLLKGEDETEWTFHIENHSQYVVSEVWCPLIGKIDSLSGDPQRDHLIWPRRMGMRIPYPRATFDVPGRAKTPSVENRATWAIAPGWPGYSDEAR